MIRANASLNELNPILSSNEEGNEEQEEYVYDNNQGSPGQRDESNQQYQQPYQEPEPYQEPAPRELTEEEQKEKNNLVDLIDSIQNNFKNLGKKYSSDELEVMTLEELRAQKERLTKKILNKGFDAKIDKLYGFSNMLYETGLKSYNQNFKGLKEVLDQDEGTKDAFKLMLIEKVNMQFASPTTKYLFGLTQAITTTYSLNKTGLPLPGQNINMSENIKNKINKMNTEE